MLAHASLPLPRIAVRRLVAGLVGGAAIWSAPAAADAAANGADAPDAADAPEIVVTGAFARDLRDSSSPVAILAATELQRELRPQLGEALAGQAGVSATSFGPNASRPVLRGFQGERVRVLTDGIGAFDVSNTSADHAVAIDPLLAERIEVLRGPASLRFGSSAIGGVVNVLDSRIPTTAPERLAADVTASLGTAARERAIGAAVTVPLTGTIAVKASGGFTETSDMRIGGPVLSDDLRAAARGSSDPDIRALADLRGRLPNSAGRTLNGTLGVVHATDGGDLGVAISRYEALYGLPIRFSVEPGAEQEAVAIDAVQTRLDVRANIRPASGFVERISFRGGYADYAHVETEGDGAVGTLFANEAYEARLEIAQRKRGGWQGVSGVQTMFRDFLAVGAEAFVPPNETIQNGIFTLQEVALGPVRIEAGARAERTRISSRDVNFDRGYTAVSGALGGFFTLSNDAKIGINFSTTARAPAAEELLADGPHVGTQSYEIGDPSFGIERARGAELILRLSGPAWRFDAAAYVTRFTGYIYEFATGAVIQDLPVFQFAQGKARYRGIEATAEVDVARSGGWTVTVDGVADLVRATIDDFGNAPRIPPARLLLGLGGSSEAIDLRVEGEVSAAQNRVTGFETATSGFTRVNTSIAWRPRGNDRLSLLLSGNNLLNANARRHASFLKDYAPLAGRDIRLSVRGRF